ncbi:hypothetical protein CAUPRSCDRAFT_13018 [Caulochytrium protostelioides]|nr:hypothetical protein CAUPRSCDRAFT_13018 [Caulochytrium protostelioides]
MQAALPSQFGLTPTALQVQFIQSDLVADPLPLGPAAGTDPATPPCRLLITAFVLNELLALQKAHFHRVVRHVLTQLPADAHWLVVDAASSFSDVAIAGRAYRVHHLLDHIPQLDCVEARDSHWYRFPKGLQSPDPLQNMRYWMRLYRRKAA